MAVVKFPPLSSYGSNAIGTVNCLLVLRRFGNELHIDHHDVKDGEGISGNLKELMKKQEYLASIVNNIFKNLEGWDWEEEIPHVMEFKCALVETVANTQIVCYDDCTISTTYPTALEPVNPEPDWGQERHVSYVMEYDPQGRLISNLLKRVELGVLVMHKGGVHGMEGRAWGVTYSDGQSTSYGWLPASHPKAEIRDPQYCSKPTDVTYKGSSYVPELEKNGVLKKVRRVTKVEVLD